MPRAPDPIVVAGPDPRWAALFTRLAAPIRQAVADLDAVVEHVGSTAVPGLAAKPVIDIDVVVASADVVGPAIDRLGGLGYRHEGNLGIDGREALHWPPGSVRHHLYVVVVGSPAHRDHVDLRDSLRADPALAAEYAALKRDLARRFRHDRVAYLDAKSAFIARALAAARDRAAR